MVKATGLPHDGFCMDCFNGDYPVPYDPQIAKNIMERRRSRVESLGDALVKEEQQQRLF